MGGLTDDLDLGRITLGTMRFQDKNLSINEVVEIIEKGFDLGIKTHHSSHEYSSYQLYLNALDASNCKSKIKHIVKLSSPHFDELQFSSKKLEQLVDRELKNLKVDYIDVLQWLVRSQPINDNDRLQILSDQQDEIEHCFHLLKEKGKVKSVFAFPYSIKFAEEVIKFQQIDGIISYLNKEEIEYQEFADSSPFIAIRPLFAGKLLSEFSNPDTVIKDCLDFVDSHKKVLTKIVSINSLRQLKSYKGLIL